MFKLDTVSSHAGSEPVSPSSWRTRRVLSRSALAVTLVGLGFGLSACSDDDDSSSDSKASASGGNADGGVSSDAGDQDAEAASGSARYALASLVTSGEDTSLTYFDILDALEPQAIDFKDAREFSGMADVWIYDGSVFITNDEELTVTRYEFEDGGLVEGDTIGFGNYGIASIGFWLNVFLSPTKAYFVNETTEYVVWNPKTMEITGTVPMPKLEERAGLKPFASYSDRSTVIRDGLLYHPFYYSDEDYFKYDANSTIAVYDAKTDELVRVIEAPCPGLDHVTQDDDGNLYFSSWIFAPAGAAVLDQPSTCVAKIAKGADEATLAFSIQDVTDGREGGLFRFTGDGKAILSVLHPEREPAETREEVSSVAYGPNWHFWTYDFETGKAAEIDSIEWNAGAAYAAAADGKSYALVPGGDYASTTTYDISTPSEPKKLFENSGWTMRLVKLP